MAVAQVRLVAASLGRRYKIELFLHRTLPTLVGWYDGLARRRGVNGERRQAHNCAGQVGHAVLHLAL